MPALAVPSIALLPFALLLLAALGLWIHRALWSGALTAAVIVGYSTGAVRDLAALWIVVFAGLLWNYRTRARFDTGRLALLWRSLSAVAVVLFGGALGLALLPGFPRTVLFSGLRLTPDALPYAIAVGFPKVCGGILIFGMLHEERVRSWRELGAVLRRAAPIFLAMAFVVMLLTLALGYVHFEPKWTPLFWAWAPVNLFFTCLSEEAFFRGFVQRELARLGTNRARSALVALLVASLLFGLAHLAGGWKYALAAMLAGIGYGYAYQRTQRLEASMAVHFALNATHFLLFTYPALA
jgi:membrane protease YdiL (CAAX protease family)